MILDLHQSAQLFLSGLNYFLNNQNDENLQLKLKVKKLELDKIALRKENSQLLKKVEFLEKGSRLTGVK